MTEPRKPWTLLSSWPLLAASVEATLGRRGVFTCWPQAWTASCTHLGCVLWTVYTSRCVSCFFQTQREAWMAAGGHCGRIYLPGPLSTRSVQPMSQAGCSSSCPQAVGPQSCVSLHTMLSWEACASPCALGHCVVWHPILLLFNIF